jgi:microcystin-dependent protein
MSSSFNIRNSNYFSFSDLTYNLRSIDAIELGYQPNKTNPGAHAIAIGAHTGIINQGTFGIAIGFQAAQYDQDSSAIAIGTSSGQTSQHSNTIAIGENAGQNHQKPFGIALGTAAGQNTQGTSAIAIGSSAGYSNQEAYGISLGTLTGHNNQEISAIALGTAAGQNNQGSYSIAIGAGAGQTNQVANSIILNASGTPLNATTYGLFASSIRNTRGFEANLVYNNNTHEICYDLYSAPYDIGDFFYSISSNSDFDRWLLCDGRSLSVIDYPQLFSVMGYSFGGSGSVFKLPDPRGRILGLKGQGSGLSNRTLGENVGAETHTLTINEIPTHNHALIDIGHSHTITQPIGDDIASIETIPYYAANDVRETQTTITSNTGITIQNTGHSTPYNIMQPTLFMGNLFVFADR